MTQFFARMAPYKPSIILFLIALLVIIFPFLAVLMVSGLLITLGVIYIWIVKQSQHFGRYQRGTGRVYDDPYEGNPDLRKVVVRIVEGERWH